MLADNCGHPCISRRGGPRRHPDLSPSLPRSRQVPRRSVGLPALDRQGPQFPQVLRSRVRETKKGVKPRGPQVERPSGSLPAARRLATLLLGKLEEGSPRLHRRAFRRASFSQLPQPASPLHSGTLASWSSHGPLDPSGLHDVMQSPGTQTSLTTPALPLTYVSPSPK
jgi:hypothetical protein